MWNVKYIWILSCVVLMLLGFTNVAIVKAEDEGDRNFIKDYYVGKIERKLRSCLDGNNHKKEIMKMFDGVLKSVSLSDVFIDDSEFDTIRTKYIKIIAKNAIIAFDDQNLAATLVVFFACVTKDGVNMIHAFTKHEFGTIFSKGRHCLERKDPATAIIRNMFETLGTCEALRNKE